MYFKRKDMEQTTFELIDKLAEKPKGEIRYALLRLLVNGKLNFIELNKAYVDYLELDAEDKMNQLIEAETCVMTSFLNKKTRDKIKAGGRDYNHTQRCLYLLNQSKRFQMDALNKKYEYDEAFAKTMSWYKNEKANKNI